MKRVLLIEKYPYLKPNDNIFFTKYLTFVWDKEMKEVIVASYVLHDDPRKEFRIPLYTVMYRLDKFGIEGFLHNHKQDNIIFYEPNDYTSLLNYKSQLIRALCIKKNI